MRFASATDFAIRIAAQSGELRLVERVSRFGLGAYVSIEDATGVIEVQDDMGAARARVSQCAA